MFNATELEIEDLVVGMGKEAANGNTLIVDYQGWLTNGIMFDSSIERGRPFQFELGLGRVIKGWDEGLLGMKEGGKRKLVIPADLAYGDRPPGEVIPAGATLVFEVELLNVE
jgi:FKBP-type peptidyl-prolyl cis-trans isomerase